VLDRRRSQDEPGTAGRKALTNPITREANAPAAQTHMRATSEAGQWERKIRVPRITMAPAVKAVVPSTPIAAPSLCPLAQAIGNGTTHKASTGKANMRNEKSTNPKSRNCQASSVLNRQRVARSEGEPKSRSAFYGLGDPT
jgi:hypothetical protein